MSISSIGDMSSYLISQATEMKGSEVQQAISAAVLKNVLDQQQVEGEALVKMLQASAPEGDLGNRVDILA